MQSNIRCPSLAASKDHLKSFIISINRNQYFLDLIHLCRTMVYPFQDNYPLKLQLFVLQKINPMAQFDFFIKLQNSFFIDPHLIF
jgi:hypothetical protein